MTVWAVFSRCLFAHSSPHCFACFLQLDSIRRNLKEKTSMLQRQSAKPNFCPEIIASTYYAYLPKGKDRGESTPAGPATRTLVVCTSNVQPLLPQRGDTWGFWNLGFKTHKSPHVLRRKYCTTPGKLVASTTCPAVGGAALHWLLH